MIRFKNALLIALALSVPVVPAFAAYGKKGGKKTPPAPTTPDNSATITADQKDISDDRSALADAQKALDDGVAKLTATFEASDAVVAAKKVISDDAAVVQTARDAVMTKLATDSTYTAAVAKEKQARQELNDLRADNADQDAISAKATEVFNDGGVTSKLERAALDADPTYSAAEKKLTDDNKTLSDLRSKFKDGLKTDSTLASLRQARDDAQTKLTAAQTKLASDRTGSTASSSTPSSTSTPPAKSTGSTAGGDN